MLELPEIVKKLQHENLNKVSMDTNINYQQIWRIKAGRDKNPGYRIVKALSDYFIDQVCLDVSLVVNGFHDIIILDSNLMINIDGFIKKIINGDNDVILINELAGIIKREVGVAQ